MKLNNRGFAITGIMYAILVLFLVLLFSILGLLGSRKIVLDKLKSQVANKLNQMPLLADTIKKDLVSIGSGLYRIGNEYRYRGNEVNNYLSIGGTLYRIIGVDPEGIKITTVNKLTNNMPFDTGNVAVGSCTADTCPRNNAENTFCQITAGTYYGCNIYAPYSGTVTAGGKTGTVTQNSSLYQYLNTTGTDAELVPLRNVARIATWNIGPATYSTTVSLTAVKTETAKYKGQFKVGLLSIEDYATAALDATCQNTPIGNSACQNQNWLWNSSDFYPWLLNGFAGNTYEVAIINSGTGYIGYNTSYASNSYGVRPVAYLPDNTLYTSGNGAIDNPYQFSVQ